MDADANILVIDDEEAITRIFVDLVEGLIDDRIINVVAAGSGKEALDAADSLGVPFDVIILDIGLPDVNGFDLWDDLKERCPDAETIVITGGGGVDAAVRAMKMGAFDFLEKPFTVLSASQTIRNAVERKHFRQITAELSTTKRTLEAELSSAAIQMGQVRELIAFARDINEHLQLDAILDTVYERLPKMLSTDSFSLFLYEPARREFRLAVTNRPTLDAREPIIVKMDDSPIMRQAVQTREVMFVDDVRDVGVDPEEHSEDRGYKKSHSACLPLKVENRPVGVLNLNDFHFDAKIDESLNTAILIAEHLAPAISNALLYEQIQEAANRDGLTGLYNRSFFDRSLAENFRRAKRYNRPLSLLVLDIDHFKQFNDTHGHQAGDAVLKHVASILAGRRRIGLDVVARYGGEEMVMIAPETDPEGMQIVADRLRAAIEESPYDFHSGGEIKTLSVTASIGCSTYMVDELEFPNEKALFQAADEALYTAKEAGRNRAVHSYLVNKK